jgi:soluble lytic murein transglycosylase-like protein
VDRWVRRAGGPERFDTARHIRFPETRAYVHNVLERRGQYRDHYGSELGL